VNNAPLEISRNSFDIPKLVNITRCASPDLQDVLVGGNTIGEIQTEVGTSELNLAGRALGPNLLGQTGETLPDFHLDPVSD
jgi:hypothetical protein